VGAADKIRVGNFDWKEVGVADIKGFGFIDGKIDGECENNRVGLFVCVPVGKLDGNDFARTDGNRVCSNVKEIVGCSDAIGNWGMVGVRTEVPVGVSVGCAVFENSDMHSVLSR